ncbi:MAG: outer membrane protein assembly factor BamA [Magnetococcales bacterium]|nr:outer membrane protein assembly factor BamA [Magnetococcales bacterium]
MMRSLWNIVVVLAVWVLLSATAVTAADQEPVKTIRIEGHQRIEQETIRSYLPVAIGDRVDTDRIRKIIKDLHATGFFQNVSVEQDGATLVVRVEENPMVDEVSFEGHQAFGKEELDKMVQVKSRSIYNRAKMEKDLATLRQAYRIKGLFLAEIEALVKQQSQNSVSLVYRISEGEKSKIRLVRILGNKNLSHKELLKKLMMQPSDWLSWLTENDTYDREKLLFDQAQLRNSYLDQGYVRVSVESSVAEMTPDRRAFVITHALHEGERYRIGKLNITGDFDELPVEQLWEKMEIHEGEWYSRETLRQSIENLTDVVGHLGYAMLDIQPNMQIDDEQHLVNIDLQISKGRRVYVNRIEISGNNRTQDQVIRREMRLVEGDRFSSAQVRRSKDRLQSLNFFEKVDVTTVPSDQPDRVDMKVNVSEKSTGAFTVGAGFSSVDKLVGTASISQNNFLGRGQRMMFSFTLSSKNTEFDLSFTEPYFMDKEIAAGFDIFNRSTDRLSTLSFKQQSYGGAVRLGFPISDRLSDRLSYSIANIEITEVSDNASDILNAQKGLSPYLQSMISNTINWSNIDSNLMPTKGRSHRLTTDLSGLGGDVRFGRLVTEHKFYHSLVGKDDLVLHVGAKVGAIAGWSRSVPIYNNKNQFIGESGTVPMFERFYLGGPRSIRGFKQGGIGPRTAKDDPLGGTLFGELHTELLFPFPGLGDKGVRGITFLDVGMLDDLDQRFDVRNGSNSPRVSTGVGALWNSPFGPLRFEFGFPLVKEDYDKTRIFDFSVGTAL